MAADQYSVLASFYDALGMSEFALHSMPSIIQFAQQNDWIGRRVVDLGCGTGGSVRWLASQGYNITAIDPSAAMLDAARRSIESRGVALQWVQGDARAIETLHDMDLVLAIDMLNEMNSLRDLETCFTSIAKGLPSGKWFIFDLHTLDGLASDAPSTRLLRADDDITALVEVSFDHERQTRNESYLLFHADHAHWTRQITARSRRGFPVQVVKALLERTGFEVLAIVSTGFAPVLPTAPDVPRVLCFTRRSG